MKIVSIKEIADLHFPDGWGNYDGYEIITNEKIFKLLIENSQDCCESFGYITSEDDFSDFIGANILEYRCVDNANYDDIELTKNVEEYVDVFDCAFIEFKTDKGTLQFAVYNSHNGYYGHDMKILEEYIPQTIEMYGQTYELKRT